MHTVEAARTNPGRVQLLGVFGEPEEVLCVRKISFNRWWVGKADVLQCPTRELELCHVDNRDPVKF